MKTINKVLILGCISVSLSACGSFFDKDNTPTPSPLVSFTSEANVRSLWYTNTGYGIGKEYVRLAPALDNNAIYTADVKGHVAATDKNTGRSIWESFADEGITAGVGAGNGVVVVGTHSGKVIALSELNGKPRWNTTASSEILAAPAVGNNVVVIKTIDGKVTGYSVDNGRLLWTYQQTEPNLILRGASTPLIAGNSAFVGFANGNFVKLSVDNGSLQWQKTLAVAQGAFTIQRMIDIDANPYLYGHRIYATTYQGQISALESGTGQNVWSQDMSSFTGISGDNDRAYVTDAKSHVWAFDADSGTVDWRQTKLEARVISAPVTMGNYIVVGDNEGYLHWIAKQDGHFVARVKVNGSGIIAAPIVDNGTLYVLTKDGHLAAYRVG